MIGDGIVRQRAFANPNRTQGRRGSLANPGGAGLRQNQPGSLAIPGKLPQFSNPCLRIRERSGRSWSVARVVREEHMPSTVTV